jgi:hypothetical protein
MLTLAVGCGGGKGDVASDGVRQVQDKKDPPYPDHFLPRPRKIVIIGKPEAPDTAALLGIA